MICLQMVLQINYNNIVESQPSIHCTTVQPWNSSPSVPFRPRCIHSNQLRRVGRARREEPGEAAAGNAGGGGQEAGGQPVWLTD